MYADKALTELGIEASPAVADALSERLAQFLAPLLSRLDAQVDKRLVRTFLTTIRVIIQFRHRSYGLLLSELGAYILSPDQAPAGTKQLSNLLRCQKWSYTLMDRFLWHQAETRLAELEAHPLYRLRSALSQLWLAYPPPPLSFSWENSG